MQKNLKDIDRGREILRAILHGSTHSPNTRKHLERALEHIAEAWIAESGQDARTVQQVVGDSAKFRGGMKLTFITQAAEKILADVMTGPVNPDHLRELEFATRLDTVVTTQAQLLSDALAILRALLVWGRNHTSPVQPNSPHNLLVTADTVLSRASTPEPVAAAA